MVRAPRPTPAGERRTRLIFQAAFALFLFVELGTHSSYYQSGPFTWGSLPTIPGMPDFLLRFGPLALLPPVIATGWLGWRLRRWRSWWWGPAVVSGPLMGLTLLSLLSLPWEPTLRVLGQLLLWAVLWLVYLFCINERPPLRPIVALLLLLQGGVATTQFLLQRGLGWSLLGELPLDPTAIGTSVLLMGDTRWLRGYGLTGHPNAVGGLLAVGLLLLLPAAVKARSGGGWLARAALVVGLAGLLATFSRSGWLALAVGLVALGLMYRPGWSAWRRARLPLLLLLMLPLLFLLRYGTLVGTRFFSGESYVEQISLERRTVDTRIALALWADSPWWGIGAGAYPERAEARSRGAQVVHNIPLLVASELGLAGLLLWLIVVAAPFLLARHTPRAPPEWRAAWLAWMLFGLFQPAHWPWFPTVPGTILLALLLGQMAASSRPAADATK